MFPGTEYAQFVADTLHPHVVAVGRVPFDAARIPQRVSYEIDGQRIEEPIPEEDSNPDYFIPQEESVSVGAYHRLLRRFTGLSQMYKRLKESASCSHGGGMSQPIQRSGGGSRGAGTSRTKRRRRLHSPAFYYYEEAI